MEGNEYQKWMVDMHTARAQMEQAKAACYSVILNVASADNRGRLASSAMEAYHKLVDATDDLDHALKVAHFG